MDVIYPRADMVDAALVPKAANAAAGSLKDSFG
jgi:hypothetical protein